MTDIEAVRPPENPLFTSGMAKITAAVRAHKDLVIMSADRYADGVGLDPSTVEVRITPEVGVEGAPGCIFLTPKIMLNPYMPVALRCSELNEVSQSEVPVAIWGEREPANESMLTPEERNAIIGQGLNDLEADTNQRLRDISTDVEKGRYTDADAVLYRTPLKEALEMVAKQKAAFGQNRGMFGYHVPTAGLILFPPRI